MDESMKTVVELKDRNALIQLCKDILARQPIPVVVTSEMLEIELYADFPDDRIGWNKTYIVIVKGWGPMGFTDSI